MASKKERLAIAYIKKYSIDQFKGFCHRRHHKNKRRASSKSRNIEKLRSKELYNEKCNSDFN